MGEFKPKTEDDIVGPPEPERASGIMRIPNISPEDEEGLLKAVESEVFDRHSVLKGEREKTPEEIEIINAILAKLPEFIKRYSGNPVDLKPDHVHVIDYNKLTDQEKKTIGNVPGRFSTVSQKALIISKSDNYSAIKFAQVAVHELIHFNSFQSVGYDKETRKLFERRIGFATAIEKDKDPSDEPYLYFHAVNEAITAELTKRFCEEYFSSIPVLAEDVKKRDESRAKIKKGDASEIMTFSNIEESDGTWHATAEDYPYANERKNCWMTMKEIQEKDPDKFKDAEGVFRDFTEAYFSGKFLTVARLVEKTFGKGFFRRIGKNTKA